MDNSSRYFLILLTAFLKKQRPPEPDSVNWNSVYKLSKMHCLSGAAYLPITKLSKGCQPEQQILNNFKSAFCNTLVRYERQDALISEIAGQLSRKGIPHIFFKGAVIKRLYPVCQMRTLGDIDLFIHADDIKKADTALGEIGYRMKKSNGDEYKYYFNDLPVEIHYKILNEYINRNAECKTYFDNIWEYTYRTGSGYTYELDLAYHLIYLIAHMAKHLYSNGCGVRMLLDIAVILYTYGNELNFDYILSELKKIGLDVFARNIISICTKCFGLPEVISLAELDKETYEAVMDYLLEGGIFGFCKRSLHSYLIWHEFEKTDNSKMAQLRAIFKKIFPSRIKMQNHFALLLRFPFLLPVTWVIRGLKCLIFKRERTCSILKELTKSEDARKAYIIIRKIGL